MAQKITTATPGLIGSMGPASAHALWQAITCCPERRTVGIQGVASAATFIGAWASVRSRSISFNVAKC
jgi:hypothetical protein